MVTPTSPGRGVRIRVTANTAKARQDINKLDRSFGKMNRSATTATRSIARLAAGIGAAFGTGLAFRGVNRATDSLVDLENQVALVVGRTEELTKQMDRVYNIALDTRAPVASVVEAFNRLGRSLQGSGATLPEINKAVRSLSQAATISGGAVESQRAAFVQLGQGLAAGALRGQELNSVMEQLPRVSQAIAEELGVTIGQLRAIAAEGELTSEVVFAAFLNQAQKINEEFEAIELTSSKALVLFGDQLKRLIGDISRALGVTNSFTDAIVNATNFISGNRDSIVKAIVDTRDRMKELVQQFKEFIQLDKALEFVGSTFKRVLELAVQYLDPVSNFIRNWAAQIQRYFFEIYDAVVGNSYWTDTMEQVSELADRYLPQVERKVRAFADRVTSAFKDIYTAGRDRFNIDLNLNATIESVRGIKDNIITAVSDGFRAGVNTIRDLAPEIRKSIGTAVIAAFTLAFGTGQIGKAFGKVANKIGPIFLTVLAANIVQAIDSAKAFAGLGLVVGEVFGEALNQIGEALPALIKSAAGFLVTGAFATFKEAGIGGAIAFVLGFKTLFPNAFAATMSTINVGRSFVEGILGVTQRRTIGDRLRSLFTQTTVAGEGRGSRHRGATLLDPRVAPFFDAFSQGNWAERMKAFGDALRTNVVPAMTAVAQVGAGAFQSAMAAMSNFFTSLPGRIRKASSSMRGFRRAAAGAGGVLLLTAGAASASSGGDAVNNTELAIASIFGAALIGSALEGVLSKGAGFLANKFMSSFAGATLKAAPFALKGIATKIFGIVGKVLFNPITLIGSAIVAIGGLMYVYFFGEGDSFEAKWNERLTFIKRSLGILRANTAQASVDLGEAVSSIFADGRLGSNSFQNRKRKVQVDDINLQILPSQVAGRLTDAIEELTKVNEKANQDLLSFGGVTEKTNKELSAAQDRLSRALDRATAAQPKPEDFAQAFLAIAQAGDGFFGPGDTRFSFSRGFTSDIKDSRANTLSGLLEGGFNPQEIASALIFNPKSLGFDADLIGEKLGEDTRRNLFRLATATELTKEELDALTAVLVESGRALDRPARDPLSFISDNLTNAGLAVLDFLGINDGQRINPDRTGPLVQANRNAAEASRVVRDFDPELRRLFSGLRRALESQDLLGVESSISREAAPEIINTISQLNINQNRLQDLLKLRSEGKTGRSEEAELDTLQGLRIPILQDRLEKLIAIATTGGFQDANYDILRQGINEAITGVDFDINRIVGNNDGIADFFDFEKAAEEIREKQNKIDAISSGSSSGTKAAAEEIAKLQVQIDALFEQIRLAGQAGEVDLINMDLEAGELSRQKLIEVIGAAATLQGISIDPDKLMKSPDSFLQKAAKVAGGFLQAFTAMQLFNGGVDDGDDTNNSVDELADRLSTVGTALSDVLKGVAPSGGGGGGSETPIEKIMNRLSLTIEGLVALTGGQTNSLFSSLKKIEKAEKAINKSALDNVGLRKQQLDIIRQQEQAIENILLKGNVASAESAGFGPDILRGGENALEVQREINRLTRERGLLDATNFGAIASITNEIEGQQNILERMLSTSQQLTDGLADGLKNGLSKLFKEGDLKGAINAFADTFTSTIIDTFIDAFVTSLIANSGIKDFFDKITTNLFDSLKGLNSGGDSGGGVGGFFSGALSFFKGLFGFDRGGIVPSTNFSQVGKDSVPALLKPGERVQTTQEVRNMRGRNRGMGEGGATFNIHITGDVSRQTKEQIVRMLPEIASGVNTINYETGIAPR